MTDPTPPADKPGLLERAFPGPKKPKEPREPKPPRAKPGPKPGAGKKDLSDGLSMLWAMGGSALSFPLQWVTLEDGRQIRVPVSPAAGRVMQVQAPAAGRELNKWIKDHDLIYRWVEPFLGQQGLNVLMEIVAPPLLVGILERKPEAAPLVMPILGPMLFSIWKESKRQEAKAAEMLADLGDEGADAGAEFAEFMDRLGIGGPEPDVVREPEPEPVA